MRAVEVNSMESVECLVSGKADLDLQKVRMVLDACDMVLAMRCCGMGYEHARFMVAGGW